MAHIEAGEKKRRGVQIGARRKRGRVIGAKWRGTGLGLVAAVKASKRPKNRGEEAEKLKKFLPAW